jgi:hypothetical protein
MNHDTTRMSVNTTFLVAAVALHALTISARPIAAWLPALDTWGDANQDASACVPERATSGYLAAYSALLAATAGGDGTSLVAGC